MNPQALFDRLSAFPARLTGLLTGITAEDATWKPADGAWSVLEIVRHLEDEEVEDFRTRVRMTLEDHTQTWPPIDPEGVAVQRKYNEDDLQKSLARLIAHRHESLNWVQDNITLIGENTETAYEHPRFGPIKLGELFAAWVAHDQLHLRQIVKRLFQMTERDAGNFSTRYAGDW